MAQLILQTTLCGRVSYPILLMIAQFKWFTEYLSMWQQRKSWWLILCANLIHKITSSALLWVCLWWCFWMRLMFELLDWVKGITLSKVEGFHSVKGKVRMEQKLCPTNRRELLLPDYHEVLFCSLTPAEASGLLWTWACRLSVWNHTIGSLGFQYADLETSWYLWSILYNIQICIHGYKHNTYICYYNNHSM